MNKFFFFLVLFFLLVSIMPKSFDSQRFRVLLHLVQTRKQMFIEMTTLSYHTFKCPKKDTISLKTAIFESSLITNKVSVSHHFFEIIIK